MLARKILTVSCTGVGELEIGEIVGRAAKYCVRISKHEKRIISKSMLGMANYNWKVEIWARKLKEELDNNVLR